MATIQQLIEQLQDWVETQKIDPNTEVVIGTQPNYPIRYWWGGMVYDQDEEILVFLTGSQPSDKPYGKRNWFSAEDGSKVGFDRPSYYHGYHKFQDPEDQEPPHGSFEVYEITEENEDEATAIDPLHARQESGWYWHPCFPGCSPDGDEEGPFPTAKAAWEAAQRY